jgi:hypothetical protein
MGNMELMPLYALVLTGLATFRGGRRSVRYRVELRIKIRRVPLPGAFFQGLPLIPYVALCCDGPHATSAPAGGTASVLCRKALVLRRISRGPSQRTCPAEWKISTSDQPCGGPTAGTGKPDGGVGSTRVIADTGNTIAIQRNSYGRAPIGNGRGLLAGRCASFL